MKRYFRIWLQFAKNAFASITSTRLNAITYFFGKLVRTIMVGGMILTIYRTEQLFAGYTREQAFLIFATYLLVDYLTQIIFRGIYYFRHDLRKGLFDGMLTKPMHPLFAIMARFVDMIDIVFFPLVLGCAVFAFAGLKDFWSVSAFSAYVVYLGVALFIGLSIHIIAAGVLLIALETDVVIWLYRYTMLFGSIPAGAFPDVVRLAFTFVFPIFIMTNVPADAFFGNLTVFSALGVFAISGVFFVCALRFWNAMLARHASVSM